MDNRTNISKHFFRVTLNKGFAFNFRDDFVVISLTKALYNDVLLADFSKQCAY